MRDTDTSESWISSRLAARSRRHSPRHAARAGRKAPRRPRPEAEATAPELPDPARGMGENRPLQELAGQLTQEDLHFLGRLVAFLAEQNAAGARGMGNWTPADRQAAAASEPETAREAVVMVVGPCDAREESEEVARDIAAAPGFELLLHSYRDGYHHLDGRTADPPSLAAWVARRPGVASVELDLDVLRVVPRLEQP